MSRWIELFPVRIKYEGEGEAKRSDGLDEAITARWIQKNPHAGPQVHNLRS